MLKYTFLVFFIAYNLIGNTQVYNKIYPSVRPELLTVDQVIMTLPLSNSQAYFLSFGLPLLGPYYAFIARSGSEWKVLKHKYISDSLGYFFPSLRIHFK
ncbi:MAG: hypothetical protein IPP06_06625 [Saprospiraceae bacterium]|nr:hypothetical protein [Candidatus Vicinibacter affinis]